MYNKNYYHSTYKFKRMKRMARERLIRDIKFLIGKSSHEEAKQILEDILQNFDGLFLEPANSLRKEE